MSKRQIEEEAPSGATAEAVEEAVEEPPVIVPWDSFKAQIVEPAPDDDEVKETRESIPAGHVRITYGGLSDVFEHGEFKLRPGQPVIVPSDVAEELLTFPFETFTIEE